VRSQGVELMLGLTPTSPESKLQWDVNVNFSRNRTIIKELIEGMDHFVLWKEAKGGAWTYVGQPIGDIYDRELVTVKDKSSKYYGYPILDEDGSWQDYGSGESAAVKIGTSIPNSHGLQTTVTYKGLPIGQFRLEKRRRFHFPDIPLHRIGFTSQRILITQLNILDLRLTCLNT